MKNKPAAIQTAAAPTAEFSATSSLRVLRLPDLPQKVGLRRSAIYRMMSEGTFPRPFKLNARAVGWLESDIDAWILERSKILVTG
ncbi:AlpA family transcriptional regulator [Robbsia andropogonis]|uniref:AlpA family transcriptional regulator n=1 Tax=Robbsia andropogonis TaxID=28092 RepID=UPI003D21192A